MMKLGLNRLCKFKGNTGNYERIPYWVTERHRSSGSPGSHMRGFSISTMVKFVKPFEKDTKSDQKVIKSDQKVIKSDQKVIKK